MLGVVTKKRFLDVKLNLEIFKILNNNYLSVFICIFSEKRKNLKNNYYQLNSCFGKKRNEIQINLT